jgi:hypothetical protein
MECGSLSQPAAWSFGTTSFRQVSASVGMVRRSRDYLSASTSAAVPVKRSSFASVGGPVLRRLPGGFGKETARHHRRESYSKSVRRQAKKGCNRAVRETKDHGERTSNIQRRTLNFERREGGAGEKLKSGGRGARDKQIPGILGGWWIAFLFS